MKVGIALRYLGDDGFDDVGDDTVRGVNPGGDKKSPVGTVVCGEGDFLKALGGEFTGARRSGRSGRGRGNGCLMMFCSSGGVVLKTDFVFDEGGGDPFRAERAVSELSELRGATDGSIRDLNDEVLVLMVEGF